MGLVFYVLVSLSYYNALYLNMTALRIIHVADTKYIGDPFLSRF